MKILIGVLIFFIISALLIISNNNLSLIKDQNIKTFSQLYLNWIDKIYSNTQKITGNIIKLNWIPE